MPLKDIFCQEGAISTLQRAYLGDKAAHAYIFAGIEGVGKFKTAREYAKLLLCNEPTIEKEFADSCGRCNSCRAFDADAHPDFHHIYKELLEFTEKGKGRAAPLELPINVIREFLIAKVPQRPTLSKRKVFIVSEAQKLNIASQNSLLKVLEEPPAFCCIILLCTRLERLLPTTKSRCQVIRFLPVDEDKIIEKLQETGLPKNKAQYFARLATGSLGRACECAQLELADAHLYETKKKLIKSIATYEYAESLDLAAEVLEMGKELGVTWNKIDQTTSKTDINRRAAKTIIQMITAALYDAMKLSTAPDSALINSDQKTHIQKLSQKFDAESAAQKVADCYEMLRWIEAAVNEKLIFEHLLLKMASSDKMGVYR